MSEKNVVCWVVTIIEKEAGWCPNTRLVWACVWTASFLDGRQDLHSLPTMTHFCHYSLGLNWMLELRSSMYSIHKCLNLMRALTDRRQMKWLPFQQVPLKPSKAEDQNSMFLSHPLFSNLPSFSHVSFMNVFISITMLIANFSLLLSCLISLTGGQLSRAGETLNSAITELHASVPPLGCTQNLRVRTVPPLITSPNGVCSNSFNHSAVIGSW